MLRTRVGYTGGTTRAPTYRNIGDHAEALQLDYDPTVVSYAELLTHFFAAHDPTRERFSTQYQSAVYAADEDELALAREAGERAAADRRAALHTHIGLASPFFRAEDYHQKYRLRRHAELTAALIASYKTDRAMVDSTLAARLNGYLAGHGTRDTALAELERAGLGATAKALL